jgi:hypothetical protein
LGDGTTTAAHTATPVAGLTGVTALDVDTNHACAVVADTSVQCWGSNSFGELGDGTKTNALSPVAVAALSFGADTGPIGVAIGSRASCAVRGGHVQCWGDHSVGQMGVGGMHSTTPVAVGNLVAQNSTTVGTVPWAPAAPTPQLVPGKVVLRWSAPATGGSPITDYIVQYSANFGGAWSTFVDGVHAAPAATVGGLIIGHQYTFRVIAKNAYGTGRPSPSSVYVIPRNAPSAPLPPKVSVSPGKITLTWVAPANGGAAINDYAVQYSFDSGLSWTTYRDPIRSTPGAVLTTLIPGMTYVFRVAAFNGVGLGAFSRASVAVTAS